MSINVLKKQKTCFELQDLTVILWFCSTPLKALLSRFLYLFNAQELTQLLATIIIFLPLILQVLIRRELPSCKYFCLVFFFVGLFFCFTLFANPSYERWFLRENYGVFDTVFRPDQGAIWAFLMVEISKEPEKLFKNLRTTAIVLLLYNFFAAYQSIQVGGWTYIDYMGNESLRPYSLEFGYSSMFVSLVLFASFLLDKKFIYLFFGVVSIFMTLQYGSRGPLICLLGFLLITILFFITDKKTKIIFLPIMLFFVLLFITTGDQIILLIATQLNVMGVDSRTVVAILNNQMFDDSGRETIYALAQKAIELNPFGYGAYGDRPIIGPFYNWGYSHNICFEMAITFGVIPAILILFLILFFSFLNIVIKTGDLSKRYLVAIMFSMSLGLLISDTYWGSIYFWSLIALLICFKAKNGVD